MPHINREEIMTYKDRDTQYRENSNALDNPKPGDYWTEMFCPYFLVVAVKGPRITVLSCLGGPNSHSRKSEPNARIDHGDSWSFDYSKSMVVDRDWMERAVKYGTIPGFAADCSNTQKTQAVVQEWIQHRVLCLKQELDDLGPEASVYLLERDSQTS